jgi:transposase
MTVPSIGPIISSAMVAAIGNGDVFSEGRDFAAWLGLVPREISTGDRTILGKISKRGNRYLRVLYSYGTNCLGIGLSLKKKLIHALTNPLIRLLPIAAPNRLRPTRSPSRPSASAAAPAITLSSAMVGLRSRSS